MPIYEFRCQQCGHIEELLLKVDEHPKSACGQCHSHTLEKCVTAPRFRLKGQGYYETDEKAKANQRYIASSSNEEPSQASKGSSCQKAACDHTSHS
ncbi:MAG: FmdB family zinc ribbon protein [Candidatus Berkiella sp.]